MAWAGMPQRTIGRLVFLVSVLKRWMSLLRAGCVQHGAIVSSVVVLVVCVWCVSSSVPRAVGVL